MTRPSPASPPEDLFDAIARLLEPGQREHFYQRMLYFKHLRPEDELLRLVEAIGLLALLIREAPHAVDGARRGAHQAGQERHASRFQPWHDAHHVRGGVGHDHESRGLAAADLHEPRQLVVVGGIRGMVDEGVR